MLKQSKSGTVLSLILLFCFSGTFLSCKTQNHHRQYTEIEINARLTPNSGSSAGPLGMSPSTKPTPRTVDWQLPAGWKEVPTTGMRMGAFTIPSKNGPVTGSVIQMGGEAGGMAANIERWMRQLGLQNFTDAQMATFVSELPSFTTAKKFSGKLVDLTPVLGGNLMNNQSALVGVISLKKSQLFIKLTGPRKLLVKERADFIKFCKSIHPKL